MAEHANSNARHAAAKKSSIVLTPAQLAVLGVGEVAYVKRIDATTLPDDFQREMGTTPGQTVFAVHEANGEPLLVAESFDLAVAGAMERQLAPVTVH
ncbi:MAG: DUF1150 family protein [Flavobacteriaceae bacterium]